MKSTNFESIEWNLKHLYNEVRDQDDPNVAITVLDKRKALILKAIRNMVDTDQFTIKELKDAMIDIDKLLKMIEFWN